MKQKHNWPEVYKYIFVYILNKNNKIHPIMFKINKEMFESRELKAKMRDIK